MRKLWSRKVQAFAVAIALVATNFIFVSQASAAFLTSAQVILTNMDSSGASAIIFRFTTSAGNTGTGLTISFPSYTGGGNGAVNATQTVATTYNSTNCTAITGASANLPGTPTATGNAGTGLITYASLTAFSANTSYCGVLSGSAITANPTATGTTTAVITAGTDSATTLGLDIISNDQVVVSATVPAAFTMALSSTTDSFTSNLSSGSVVGTTGMTVTFNTNAQNGWALWGSDSNTGLKSATQGNYQIPSKTPGSNTSLSAGTENYLTGLPAAGITQGSGAGTTSATTAYASSGAGNGSGLDSTPRKLASSTGTASSAIVTIKEYAAISGVTPAASDYSDTITLVGAGSF